MHSTNAIQHDTSIVRMCTILPYLCRCVCVVFIGSPFDERLQAAYTLLENVPLIDGHNDLPYNIRKFVHNQLADFE